MDMEGALRARITGAATTAGSRVYWDERAQASALPAVTLQIIGDPQPQHLKGFDDLRRTLVQIDCWAETFAAAKALSVAVLAAVIPENTSNDIQFNRAIIDNRRSTVERAGDKSIFRQSIDLGVWWQAA